MNPCSEEEYYNQLDNMILNSYQHLRKIFKDRWKLATGEEWADDAGHLRRLLDDLGQTANKTGLHFQKSVMEGKTVAEWDLPLLSLVLQNFPSSGMRPKQEEKTALQNLKKLRDTFAHHSSSNRIPQSEFQANVKTLGSSLQSIGVSEQEIAKLIEKTGPTSSTKATPPPAQKQSQLEMKIDMEACKLLAGKMVALHITTVNFQEDPSIEKLKKIFNDYAANKTGEDKLSYGGRSQRLTWEMIDAIYKRSEQGSITAFQIIETLVYAMGLERMLQFEGKYSEQEKLELVDLMYNVAIRDAYLLTLEEKLHLKMKRLLSELFQERCRGGEKGEIDMKIRYAFVVFTTWQTYDSPDMRAVEILKEGIRRYPDNPKYYSTLYTRLALQEKNEEAFACAEKALKRFPKHVQLLYFRAVDLRMSLRIPESTAAFKKFLEVAPKDYRKVPEAYYQIATNYVTLHKSLHENATTSKELDQARIYLKLGEEAEKDQLPCFLPYGETHAKRFVQLALEDLQKKGNSCSKTKPGESVLERKVYLSSPTRKRIVIDHRESLNKLDVLLKRGEIVAAVAETPKLKQTVPKTMSALKPITLSEMNPTQDDQIFENRVLELTIMDEPIPRNTSSIQLIAQDGNGEMTTLFIATAEDNNKEMADKFRPGCRIAIMNPYMSINRALVVTSAVRSENPRCLVFLEKVENMCRFCGEENASNKCSRCKRPYCSRECQTLDWKQFNHKLICSIKY